ncbi:MAG: dienelactone hydrolase family protein [Persicimonas sp.]
MMKRLTCGWTQAAGLSALVCLVALATACAPDIPEDEDVERTQVVFDSEGGIIPLPSDAALEDDGTLPMLEGAEENSAQEDFNTYLDGLHGWLPSTPITIPISGPIDEETLEADDLLVFELTGDGEASELEVAELAFNEDSNEIEAQLAEPPEFASDLGYVLLEGSEDPEGEVVVPAQAFAFTAYEDPLVDEDGNPTTELLEGRDDEAEQLEELRQLLKPVYDAAEESGAERDDVIAASVWHTADDAFAVFDPNTGEVPLPNNFLLDEEEESVELPLPEDADELTTNVIEELNQREGFSTTADGWIPVAGSPLDADTIDTESVLLAYVDGAPELYSEDRFGVEYREEFGIIRYAPKMVPLESNLLNAGVVTTDVTDEEGRPIQPTPAFVFLRSEHVIFEDGESTVDILSDEEAEQLEEARQAYSQLFTAAPLLGIDDREDVAVAWAFDTDDVPLHQRQLAARARAEADDAGYLDAQGDPADADSNPDGFTDAVGLLQTEASFQTPVFVDLENDSELGETPLEDSQPVPLNIAIPNEEQAECGQGPYPVAIVAHGLTSSRADATAVLADTLAAACVATVAPDMWMHGDRTVGESSGEGFVQPNGVATKNNMMQAGAELAVLTDVIASGGLDGVVSDQDDLIDEDNIGYVGFSLGALLGAPLMAIVDQVDVGVLHTGGAHLTSLFLEGDLGEGLLEALPEDLDTESFEFFRLTSFLQWVLEPVDPWVFAEHLIADPLDAMTYDVADDEFSEGEELSQNEVLVQMAGEDNIVPNQNTELLADAIGVSLEDTTFPDVDHGFIGTAPDDDDQAAAEAATCARQQIAVWLASGFTGTAELGDDEQDACGLQ